VPQPGHATKNRTAVKSERAPCPGQIGTLSSSPSAKLAPVRLGFLDPTLFLPVPDPAAALRHAVLVGLFTAACVILIQPSFLARFIHAPRAERALSWIKADETILATVAEQNRRLAAAPERWDRASDETWRAEAEAGGGAFVNEHLRRPASRRLRQLIGASGGTIRHAIVMDAKGRNAAVADLTADYVQGDEAKWLMTFGRPSGTRHVAPLEPGHDGTYRACWLSEPLVDAATSRPLGAVAIALDAALVGPVLCRPTP
jgi:hypothetical protein